MKKLVVSILITSLSLNAIYCQIERVLMNYKQEGVYVVIDEKLVGESPEQIKVNFDLNRYIYFYKKGYFSQKVAIDPDVNFVKLTVDLIKKPTDIAAKEKLLIKPDTLLVSKIVTNFTASDIQEVIDQMFIKNNYMIGKSANLFPEAINEIKDTRYKIGIEIVDSDQIRSVYKAPRFMMAQINLRWSVLDVSSNKVVFFKSTEGAYFVKIQKAKGFVVSEMMERVMNGAIKEAQTKLLIDDKFKNLFINKE